MSDHHHVIKITTAQITLKIGYGQYIVIEHHSFQHILNTQIKNIKNKGKAYLEVNIFALNAFIKDEHFILAFCLSTL